MNYVYKEENYTININELTQKIKIRYKNKKYSSKYSFNDIKNRIVKEVDKISKFKNITSLTKKRKQLKNYNIINCMKENIGKKILIFDSAYAGYLPSIWNIFPEDDLNGNDEDIDTFQLNLYEESKNIKLNLIYFIENNNEPPKNEIIIDDDKNENFILINNEIKKIPNDLIKFQTIKELNEIEEEQDDYRKVFILRNIDELNDSLIDYISDNYREQLFIIIKTDLNNAKSLIKDKLKEILSDEEIFTYFDLNNIIILDSYNKLALSILKIYSYFNQNDDYDFINFVLEKNLLNKEIEGLSEELKQIKNNNHTINIKVCGDSSTGKSTFINTILEEKRCLSLPQKGVTRKNGIYISKKYHLKFIDDLGFDEGVEGKVNEEIEELKKIKNRIIIDENTKFIDDIDDIFNYSNPEPNILLYFIKYAISGSYCIAGGQLNYIKKINEKEIPIIFIINFYKKEYFNDNKKRERLIKDINKQLKDKKQNVFTDEKYKKLPLNCYEKKGFVELFEELYNLFKNKIIENDILFSLENSTNYGIKNYDLKTLIKENTLFKDIQLEYIVSEQMKASVKLINILILNLTGQYSGTGTLVPFIKFWFSRVWDRAKKKIGFWRPSHEFYPLLTDLIMIFIIFLELKKL